MKMTIAWGMPVLGLLIAGFFLAGWASSAHAESYRESTVAHMKWSSDSPIEWSATAPTRITEHRPRYVKDNVIYVRHGRFVSRESAVQTKYRQNVMNHTIAEHAKHLPNGGGMDGM